MERPTRATRAVLTTSADEFASVATPAINAATGGGTAASILAVRVDSNAGAGPGENGNIAAVREQVIELVRRNLRGTDVVAHASPDDVLVLLQGAAASPAVYVATRLCAAVRNHAFAGIGGERPRPGVTVSIGVAAAAAHGADLATLSEAARRACATVADGGGDGTAVVEATPGDSPTRQLELGRFIGRAEELATLRRWLEEAITGLPRAVAVIGEAGAGRSALLRQLAPEVRLRGGSLVVARAKQLGVRTPYGIWSQVLRALGRLPDAPTRNWQELSKLQPEIPGTAESRAGSQYRLLEEISQYVRLAARSRPLVLILDEMQWVDTASWDVLDHLFTQFERERILIGLTIRDEVGQTDVAERRRALSRVECYHELRLSRLTRDELKRWLEAAMHRQEAGRELLAYVYRHTEGNPLAIMQLLRCMVEEGSLRQKDHRWEWTPPSELQLPAGIDAVIARRVAHFTPAHQAILGTAAVLGREFQVEVLHATQVATREEVRAAIDEAVAKDILQPNYERGGGGQGFSHSRIADGFVAAIPPDKLPGVHERVARALTGRPYSAAEAAVHFEQAGCALDAYRSGLEAAAQMENLYAYEAAGEFLQIAARNATSPGELAEVRVQLAYLADTLGRFDEAEELCDLAIEWFAGQGDRGRALSLKRLREKARKELGQHARATLDALRVLDEEAEALGALRERVEILTMLSQTYGRVGDNKEAERLAAECVKMAEQMNDDQLLAGALNRLAIAVEQEHPRHALEYYERALELYQAAGNVRGQANCHSNLGIVAHLEGRHDDARKELTIAISLARAAGMPDLSGTASVNLGVLMQKLGEYDRARELYDDALALCAGAKNSELQLYVLYNMANLDRERRDFSSGAQLYENCASLAQRIGQVDVELGALSGEGICLLEMGRIDDAKVPLAAIEDRLGGVTGWFQGRELVEALRIRIAASEGRSEDVVKLYEAGRALAERAADLSSAAWLTAMVADALHTADPAHLKAAMDKFSQAVDTLGYAELTQKFEELQGLQAQSQKK